MDGELHIISELLDMHEQVMKDRRKRFKDLTETEIIEIQKNDAVSKFIAFRSQLDPRIDTYDCFLYWFDDNYPHLYEEHKDDVWRRIRG